MRKLFKNPRAISAIVPPAPAEGPGGGSPRGGRGMSPWSLVVVFWRVVWYLRGCDRINVVPVVPGHAWPSWPWPWPSWLTSLWSMDMSPSCGCDTPTNASVYNVFSGVLCLDLRNINVARIVIAIKQTTTERNGDEREVTTTKPTAARTVTRSPLGRRGMDD